MRVNFKEKIKIPLYGKGELTDTSKQLCLI